MLAAHIRPSTGYVHARPAGQLKNVLGYPTQFPSAFDIRCAPARAFTASPLNADDNPIGEKRRHAFRSARWTDARGREEAEGRFLSSFSPSSRILRLTLRRLLSAQPIPSQPCIALLCPTPPFPVLPSSLADLRIADVMNDRRCLGQTSQGSRGKKGKAPRCC